MTRSMVLAILTFSLLIIGNVVTFGILSFRTLSERMVTERLCEGLNEAYALLQEEAAVDEMGDPYRVSRKLAPRLARLTLFQAVVVCDRQGRVLHREMISKQVFHLPQAPARSGAPSRESDGNEPFQAAQGVRHIPVQAPGDRGAGQLVLEYNEETVRKEVEALRSEFNQKMALAVGISLLFLCTGLAYVLNAYKRSKALQEEARKADRMAYVGTLSSNLAHEIRNPLNSMNMNVQLIQEELGEMGQEEHAEILEMLEGTRNEVHRLERLVSSFLAYARPMNLQKVPTSVNDLLKSILMFLDPECREKGVLVQFEPGDIPLVPMDESQMRQALLNVIQNAIQVLQRDQHLFINTRKAAGDKVLVVIRDEGPGISPEELKNIFKEFYSTKRGGTGLGLPIAQRIAELHMGGIKVESEIGVGTSFTFILPTESPSK